MKIIILENYYSSENTYLVYDEETMDGIVIDPGYEAKKIKARADEEGIKIGYILITHCHYDHIQYLEELREITGAKLVSGNKASINIGDPDINISYGGLGYEISAKKSDIVLSDGEILKFGNTEVKCVYTPGHTNCGVCYIIGNSVFVGDTLFLRNCGRWDLPTGDQETLEKSIRNVLYKLDDSTEVYPGHGEKTSIGYEKKFNFFVPESEN
jgi:glyoxylase-like metal-dependent hydrolase (beta-lactamase superfamily II)